MQPSHFIGEPCEFANGAHCPIARIRRGKYVVIPAEWRGKVTDPSTIRKRQSKQSRKARNHDPRRKYTREVIEGRAPRVEDW